eukprot:1144219-Pelagomonas_calceolata.AAC.4
MSYVGMDGVMLANMSYVGMDGVILANMWWDEGCCSMHSYGILKSRFAVAHTAYVSRLRAIEVSTQGIF